MTSSYSTSSTGAYGNCIINIYSTTLSQAGSYCLNVTGTLPNGVTSSTTFTLQLLNPCLYAPTFYVTGLSGDITYYTTDSTVLIDLPIITTSYPSVSTTYPATNCGTITNTL